ncbi:MAG: GpE family phage tail protein [Pseudohongiella sp.]|nr:GpE family phage tail protein [Pseudohongiella sp.]
MDPMTLEDLADWRERARVRIEPPKSGRGKN